VEEHPEADDAPPEGGRPGGRDAEDPRDHGQGFLHRHLQESSTLEEMTLTIVPYWVIPASARTSVVSDRHDDGGRVDRDDRRDHRRDGRQWQGRQAGGEGSQDLCSRSDPRVDDGQPGQGRPTKTYEMEENYNFPVVAINL